MSEASGPALDVGAETYDLADVNGVLAATGFGGVGSARLIEKAKGNYLQRTVSVHKSGIMEACGWLSPTAETGQHGEVFRLANASTNEPIFELWSNWDSSKKLLAWFSGVWVAAPSAVWTDGEEIFWQLKNNHDTGAISLTIDRGTPITGAYTPGALEATVLSYGVGRWPQSYDGRIGPSGIWTRELLETEADFLGAAPRLFADVAAYEGA